jgi:hypothetical protein
MGLESVRTSREESFNVRDIFLIFHPGKDPAFRLTLLDQSTSRGACDTLRILPVKGVCSLEERPRWIVARLSSGSKNDPQFGNLLPRRYIELENHLVPTYTQ